jgi:integrase
VTLKVTLLAKGVIMRPLKKHKPFTLYQKQTKSGPVWYARFWDETSRRYAVTRSTGILVEGKRRRRYEAEQAARAMLPSIRFDHIPDKDFVRYAAGFWTANSPYARECETVRKKPLSAGYVKNNRDDIRRHIEPFPGFRGVSLQALTAGMIRDWMTWAAGQGMSGRRINAALQAVRIAVRYAVSREELEHDPFRHIQEAPESPREKGILTVSEAQRLINAPLLNPRSRLAVLLGLLCGMRRGEVRGLLWGDITDGLIDIRHNWIDGEGFKKPKTNSVRKVPYPESVAAVLKAVRNAARNPGQDQLVMESDGHPGRPVSVNFFRYTFSEELKAIGISAAEQKRRNISFHSLRHTYITIGRLSGISDMEIRALAGHRSGAMTERYSHAGQVIDFDGVRERLQKAMGE